MVSVIKTEVVFFSLANGVKPKLIFDNSILDFTDHHKHLGLTFSNDGRWHEHLGKIIITASNVLNSMKLIKYKVNRRTLNQMYISYLRQTLEYASVLFDNCTLQKKD